jgi:fructokinase
VPAGARSGAATLVTLVRHTSRVSFGDPVPMPAVVVVGEALVDVVVAVDGTESRHPGGSPANVAVGLGRLGHPVRLVTALGDDEDGRLVRAHLEASGVEVVAERLERTSTARAVLDGQGVATYDFDLEWRLPAQVDLGSAGWLHVGSVAATLEPGATVLRSLVRGFGGRVSYDVNCRPALMPLPAETLGLVEQLVPHCDLVELSDEDAAWLARGMDLAALARRWQDLGARRVVVTQGARGSACFGDRGEGTLTMRFDGGEDAARAEVVDTVGAGDSFMSGLISSLSRHDHVHHAMDLATKVSGITVTRAGADPPWAADLR